MAIATSFTLLAAREIARHPFLEGDARGEQCAAGGQPRALPQRFRPGHPQPALLGGGQGSTLELPEILPRMYERELAHAERLGCDQVPGRNHALANQPVLEERVLRDGEWMPGRQREMVPGMV
jgi:hypothetical protein